MTFRIKYKHDQTLREETFFVNNLYIRSTVESAIEDWLFDNVHRYNSLSDANGERWHGTFTFEFKKVSRPDDHHINREIIQLAEAIDESRNQITRMERKVDKLHELLKTPYNEMD